MPRAPRVSLRLAAVAVALALAGVASGLPGCIIYLSPQCDDRIRNGDESDIDCGGTCGPCNIGDRCRADADCEESTCAGGTCAPLPCGNGIRDGAETDVDCGGSTCRQCAGGRTCAAASDCFNGDCVAGSNTCRALGTVTFAPATAYATGLKGYALFAGDLDGDGDTDLAAANELDSTVTVFINTGVSSGTFQRMPSAFPTGVYPTGGAIADFNRDGIPDIVTADYRGDSISVLLGAGGGALAAKASYATVPGGETSNLAVGDLDGDGNVDVVATNPIGHSVSVFLGRPDGTLATAVDVQVGIAGASTPYSAAIGDYNGDGKLDLAIADVSGAALAVRLGNGDGTFQREVPYREGGTGPYIMITRDVDLDGNLDLVCANRGSDDVSVLLGRGDGTFRKPIVSSVAPGKGPYSVAVADINLDGVPDVITANFMSSTATVLLGIGNGGFDPAIDAGAMGELSYGVVAADLDGDGKPDIATANAVSNDVTVRLSTSQ